MSGGAGPAGETSGNRLKRLRLRSWRRGTKEMDLILGRFADARLGGFAAARLAAYEALLEENDPDLYQWVSGQAEAPAVHGVLLDEIRRFHRMHASAATV